MKFRPVKLRSRLAFVLRHLPKTPVRLLDVGNLGDGGAYFSQIKNVVLKNGGEYVGLDSNGNLAKKMGENEQIVGDLHQAPVPDASFDCVYAGEIIEHTWEPRTMIRECHRILRPGGLFILDTPNPYNCTVLCRLLFRKENSLDDVRSLAYSEAEGQYAKRSQDGEVLLQPQHKIFFIPATLERALQTNGFVIEEWGCTIKARFPFRLFQYLFPQTGTHICCVARKATIKEAFADVSLSKDSAPPPSDSLST